MDDGLPLQSPRVTLRRLTSDDSLPLLAIYGNPQTAKFEFWPEWSEGQVADLILSQSDIYLGDPGVPFVLASVDRNSGVLIGSIQLTLTSVEDRQGELGFSFNPEFCGRGLATESVHAALGFAFSRMGIHRIFAGVDARNERSWRLMARIGMRREAHFVHANLIDGDWADDYTYAMLESEWSPMHSG
ncbi:Spermidine N(1)-acetyltransferase [Rubripirellula amarantea]|uniref:Spermidine N(1)-acetyltransferase n=1 Tax=Rubripirellula amarantea TaxID=2527999 RepID=A0A5C5WL07_9BACT|nr:GNAT family protein [Rubripirellula amarantea]TWT51464.1 Spermidine N(1)-acetyltransferase [Rubripirellula amarantea]